MSSDQPTDDNVHEHYYSSSSRSSIHSTDRNSTHSDQEKRRQLLLDSFENLDQQEQQTHGSSSDPIVTLHSNTLREQYESMGAPYEACPLVTSQLHLPVPTPTHTYLFPDQDDFMPLVGPYPFRPRAGGRLERRQPSFDRIGVWPKRHSLGNGQIDRLVQRGRVAEDPLEDRIHWLTRGYYVMPSDHEN
ncbi:hypothetical protein BC941DRAFT_518348 [Chlamydoabsidia padenii]|nr:hypothetical protein BC941DRAFT_518348 [Chlamydoabsidia padenii]